MSYKNVLLELEDRLRKESQSKTPPHRVYVEIADWWNVSSNIVKGDIQLSCKVLVRRFIRGTEVEDDFYVASLFEVARHLAGNFLVSDLIAMTTNFPDRPLTNYQYVRIRNEIRRPGLGAYLMPDGGVAEEQEPKQMVAVADEEEI